VSSVSVPIFVEAGDATSRLHYKATLTRSGQPVAAEELTISLEGDGSLQPGHDAKRIVRETDASGVVPVTWYRRTIFGRNIKATLSVSAPHADCSLTLEPAAAPETLPTGWKFTVR